MAGSHRHQPDTVERLATLGEEIRRYDFFAVMRLLETLHHAKPRLGESQLPEQDCIRLGQELSMQFAPSSLYALQQDETPEQRWHLQVLFYGMFGPNGALPLHLTDYVLERKRNAHDSTMVEFIDIFHHRLLSLFYRAWANKEPTVQYDRPETDRFHSYVGSLLGIGVKETQNRDRMPDDNKMHFAAHFGAQTRHVSGLAAVLRAFFQVPLQVEEFVGEWLKIPEENVTRLGQAMGGQLGGDTVLGGYSWQRQYKFRIRLGPLSLADYETLLPNGDKLKLLGTVVRNYLGDELNWDVNLVLRQQEVPKTCLGQYGQLGLNSWVLSQAPTHDAADLFVGIRC